MVHDVLQDRCFARLSSVHARCTRIIEMRYDSVPSRSVNNISLVWAQTRTVDRTGVRGCMVGGSIQNALYVSACPQLSNDSYSMLFGPALDECYETLACRPVLLQVFVLFSKLAILRRYVSADCRAFVTRSTNGLLAITLGQISSKSILAFSITKYLGSFLPTGFAS